MSSVHLQSTYYMFPNDEKRVGDTPFFKRSKTHFIDYLNLIFYAGGAAFFFIYFIEAFDSFGYIMFVFGVLIFCEIMAG